MTNRLLDTSVNRDYIVERTYKIRTYKLKSKLLLFDYLSKFPLFGYKCFDQYYLNKIHSLFLINKHKTLKDKAKLI